MANNRSQKWMLVVSFAAAGVALLMTTADVVVSHTSWTNMWLRLLVPVGLLLLSGTMLFGEPRSKAYRALILASCSMSIVAIAAFGYRLAMR